MLSTECRHLSPKQLGTCSLGYLILAHLTPLQSRPQLMLLDSTRPSSAWSWFQILARSHSAQQALDLHSTLLPFSGAVCNVISSMSENQTQFYRRMDVLNHYMEAHSFPHALRIRMREYFRFRKQVDHGSEWKELMNDMSDQLQVRRRACGLIVNVAST